MSSILSASAAKCSADLSITTFSISTSCYLTLAGGGEQHASALQVPRHVRLVRTEDLLEGHAGLPGGRQDAEGPFPERRASDAEQSGQRDAVEQSQRIASQATRAKEEAAEESRERHRRS